MKACSAGHSNKSREFMYRECVLYFKRITELNEEFHCSLYFKAVKSTKKDFKEIV